MGIFDTFVGKVKCPHCDKEVKAEVQSKDFNPSLHTYEIGDSIWSCSSKDMIISDDIYCIECKGTFNVNIIIKNGQFVNILNNEQFYDFAFDTQDNINPDNTAKAITYRHICETGLGWYFRRKRNNHASYQKPGEIINIFESNWEILDVYQEHIKRTNNYDSYLQAIIWKSPSIIYKVKNDKHGERLLVLNFNTQALHLVSEDVAAKGYELVSIKDLLERSDEGEKMS